MSANVVQNRFDDVRKNPQPISHYCGSRAPKIVHTPSGQRFRFFPSTCRFLTDRPNPPVECSLGSKTPDGLFVSGIPNRFAWRKRLYGPNRYAQHSHRSPR